LKPAFEPVVVGRKPFGKGVTVAENVLTWGVGGLNIDGSRIPTEEKLGGGSYSTKEGLRPGHIYNDQRNFMKPEDYVQPSGRWPANVIFDEVTAGLLDEQSGVSKSATGVTVSSPTALGQGNGWNAHKNRPVEFQNYADSGGASRFFYVAKASKRDRNEGLEELEAQRTGAMQATADGSMLTGSGNERTTVRQNFHPTVKPTALMRYLIKLVTPPGGTVLDPFTGSGSTGKAALLDGFQFVGVELTEEYLPIIEGRLRWASEQVEDDGVLF
jgi:site-specific DNA-methyltransferase (adenine-specific)